MAARANVSPLQITPQDFRLRPGSPGKGAGEGGRDLGADADLVGPGKAYERWKKTPAYQEWLKASGQTAANPPPGRPFVRLGAGGKGERPFGTLAEAIADADDGGTIEVRGDGPFVLEPINIGSALTIKAGQGFRPVIRLSPEAAKTDAPLLQTRASLILEGMEFHRVSGKRGEDSATDNIISSETAPLRVANCRFLCTPGWNAIWAKDTPLCEVRNCEFLSKGGNGIDCYCSRSGRLIIDNCLSTGAACFGVHTGRQPKDVSIRLTRNSLRVEGAFVFMLDHEEGIPAEGAAPPFRMEAAGNLFDVSRAALRFEQTVELLKKRKELPATEAEALLRRLLKWEERESLYGEAISFLGLSARWSYFEPTQKYSKLSDWELFWGLTKTRSVQGRIRYQGGDIAARAAQAPEQLKPEDFRLRPDSPGKGAGEGGRDLGADVDLVGPGAGYERWKKTPEYRQWLESVSRMLRDKP